MATSKKMNAFSTDALKAAYLPSVYAMAALRYGRPGVDQVKNEWMDYYTAGLRFEWNLLAWGGDKYNIEKQTLETEKLDLRESQLRSQLRTQISSIMNDLSLLKQTMALLEQQIRQEQLKQDLVRARLQEGLATATEVVDAETSCTGALLRMEQTKIQYSMKLAELAATVGNPS
jgi:outer membrane protein TolC